MKLPKNYLENLSSSTYKEYMKIMPSLNKGNTHSLTTLIFTIIALIVFGVFAIRPTISTIVELQKQVSDGEAIEQQMQTKINNLQNLQTQYNNMSGDLPILYDALPASPEATLLVSQIETILQQTHLKVAAFTTAQVQLVPPLPKIDGVSYFTFSIQATGQYQDMLQFASASANFNRLVSLQTLTITRDTKDESLLYSVEGRGYFKN